MLLNNVTLNLKALQYRLISEEKSIAPLIVFRLLFGLLMLYSLVRFVAKGWIADLYLNPRIHFSYYGFEWVQNPGEFGVYLLFGLAFVGVIGILLGAMYRFSSVIFFLSFTYLELIDKTNYLNHYYFVSLVSFLIIFLPMNRGFSIDQWRNPSLKVTHVPAWMINVIKLQLAIVYCYAGIAKLNYDWLIEAMPLKIWLKAHVDFPVFGVFFAKDWVAYFFSWFGAVYDLFIAFFLMSRKFRPYAYFFVISFHVLTWLLFPIGVFPWVMIAFSTIFMSVHTHERIIEKLNGLFDSVQIKTAASSFSYSAVKSKLIAGTLIVFVVFQLLFPWRFLMYPNDLFWSEEGYRFSWRVMLIEKAGYATFYVTDPETGERNQIFNSEYLTPLQEKMMATQPDMIWQFAQFIKKEYQKKGVMNPVINAEVYATLNGKRSRLLIDPSIDLTKVTDSFAPKEWITEGP